MGPLCRPETPCLCKLWFLLGGGMGTLASSDETDTCAFKDTSGQRPIAVPCPA